MRRALHMLELRWHYRCISRIEDKIGSLETAELRKEFAAQSVAMVNGHFKRLGMNRRERRNFLQDVARGQ